MDLGGQGHYSIHSTQEDFRYLKAVLTPLGPRHPDSHRVLHTSWAPLPQHPEPLWGGSVWGSQSTDGVVRVPGQKPLPHPSKHT